ncbi:MAG: hypothetical protein M1365_04980, partial [Actinobacteria bacterium]|nr:hypothetical protein [Actinomycetota bacterium]
ILIPARDSMKNEIINKLGQSGSIGKGSEIINFYKNRSKTDIGNKCFSDADKVDLDKLVEHITSAVLKELDASE